MARYQTTIASTLSPEDAFAYMADFSNAQEWDPSVSEAHRDGDAFALVAEFAGRSVPLRYEVKRHDPPRQVQLEARNKSFFSRDTITVSPAPGGSSVHYDALLEFTGAAKILDPLLQLAFNRTGKKATSGMQSALNR